MISLQEAIIIAEEHLASRSIKIGKELQLMKERTQEFEYGWVFFYQSKKYLETGNVYYMLGGNSPFIINRNDASMEVTGTAHPVEKYIKEYIDLQHCKSKQ